MSLRTRLALIVAVVVAVVVGGGSLLQVELFRQRVESDLRKAAGETAQAIVEEFGSWNSLPGDDELLHRLEEWAQVPPTRSISLLLVGAGDAQRVLSTTTTMKPREVALARRAIEARTTTWGDNGATLLVSAPLTVTQRQVGAVVVTISLEELLLVTARQRLLLFWFTVGAVVTVTLLVTLLARRFIHVPIEQIVDTMTRAGAGDLGARAPVARRDEIGKVAGGLNEMLARTQQLNASLQDRVDEATRELRKSNDDLVSSYQRMFALREALARAEQTAAAGQTAANLAHQIGTPLNLISGYVQMMLEEGEDLRQAERLRSVQEQIKKVTGYIRTTLDHVRRPPLARNPVFPDAMLRRISDVSRPRLHAAGIDIQLDVAADLPWLLGDPVQLELALLNLINNGLEAMPDGGTLTIRARAEGASTIIEVSDTGSGIPEELLPRIFEPWVTTKPLGRGTGLGLSITREVITAHGGSIRVAHTQGPGATFVVELPGKPAVPAIREV